MNGFILHLQDATQYQRFVNVVSFVGVDASGSFGLQAKHERFITALIFGLARFRLHESAWQYIALPGGVLHFVDNQLYVSTRRYLLDDNYRRINRALQDRLRTEEDKLHNLRQSLRNMEEEMFKRLWQVRRSEPL